ncbi:MAG: P-loop NTPase fold protein [Thermodesulfobacteriota bacterium]|nr:P-loop NTPase fold protein [Thermodesulfobacteriota bacterium]
MAKKRQSDPRTALKLLSDQALGEGTPSSADGLGFRMYARILSDVAVQTPGPFTVGVFGEWGTGKTSLMRLVQEHLAANKNVITVWFNAWRYESEEQPIIPLVATIVREIERNSGFASKLVDGGKSLLRSLRAIAYGFSAKSKVEVPGFAEIEASFAAKDMIDRAQQTTPDHLLDRSIFFEAFHQLSDARIPDTARVIALIDDLDRCFPDKAIRLLESIKLVLAQPGFIFFLGVARRVIEGYLQHRYDKEYGVKGFEGHAYLDKIVQLPFHIPPHANRMSSFWDSVISRLDVSDRQSFQSLVPIINQASGSNPRSAVRFVNNLLVDRAIFKATAGDVALKEMPIAFFAVSRSIEQRWPAMFGLLAPSRDVCNQVAMWMTDGVPDMDSLQVGDLKEVAGILTVDQDLRGLLATAEGIHWLTEHDRRSATIDFLEKERAAAEKETTEPAPKYDVYLTYMMQDRDAGLQVRRALNELGISVFDMTEMIAASSVRGLLDEELARSRAMVALIGESTQDGENNLMFEIGLAQGLGKKVIPVQLPGLSNRELPINLTDRHCLKLKEISAEALFPIKRTLVESR